VKGVDLLTFSKSGRPLKAHAWTDKWRTVKYADAIDVLNEYDLVFSIDIVCFAPQLAGRKRVIPYYVDILEGINVPWTAMYHGGLYPSKYDPILERLLKSKTFTGTLVTTRLPQAHARLDKFGVPIRYVNHPFLPFDRSVFDGFVPPKKRRREVVMTSRIAVNKGQNAAFSLMPMLKGAVNLWGYNAFGLPSIGWRLCELGNALGYDVIREPELRADAAQLTHPNARRFYTGRFEFGLGAKHRIRYHDEYAAIINIDWSPWIHLAATSVDFGGSLEYCTLNGIAAGCVAIVPEHAIEYTRNAYKGYDIYTFPYTKCNLWAASMNPDDGPKGGIQGGFDKTIADSINNLLTMDERNLKWIANNQQRALVDLHDPQRIARKIFKEALK
jgi:glycosyltransferase involved in cell wall biosynthesis